ncbi:MAG: GH39 family glycosyl hydrolase, partial [Turicibacter sp.]
MSYTYEKIDFNDLLGANISIHEIESIHSHWHESMEILFVTKGEVSLLVDGVAFHLKQDDLILINSKEIHSVKSNSENILIAIQLDLNQFSDLYKNIEKIVFKCRSFEHSKEDERFVYIRNLLAQMISYDMKAGPEHSLKISALLHELVYVLINTFCYSLDTRNETKSFKHLERLNRVVTYLQKNYNQDITLSQISSMEGLSPQYFSKFFEKHMGVNFLTYLNLIRLEHAVKDLINTDYNITDIALNHGFPNVTSFTTLFKNTYDETPSLYRKKLSYQTEGSRHFKNQPVQYLEYNTNHLSESIVKYLYQADHKMPLNVDLLDKVSHTIEIDLLQKTQEITHNWKELITIGKAKEGLMKEVQQQLIEIQTHIGFNYIRFHGIFDDTMMIYSEDIHQRPVFNFIYVDKLFDFLLSIGLKPFVELGFMPIQMAKTTDKTIFYTESIISEPKDIQLWNLLVREFVKHCINRYGLAQVKQWYFEVWNEPDFVEYFGFNT